MKSIEMKIGGPVMPRSKSRAIVRSLVSPGLSRWPMPGGPALDHRSPSPARLRGSCAPGQTVYRRAARWEAALPRSWFGSVLHSLSRYRLQELRMVAKPRTWKRQQADPHRALRDHVRELLRGGHAHLVFKDAIADWPVALRGTKPAGQPFTPWRLLEHIRITQWDIVEF